MTSILHSVESLLSQISDYIWGIPLLFLLLGTHIYLTVRLRFIQRFIGKAIKISFETKREGKGDISQFGALTMSLAATIGTGNIVGVGTAVAAGGPGAVLWMWLTGVFGISTKYAEALLSVKYRVQHKDGYFAGGPMYVLENGLRQKWLGVLFAIFTAVAAFGIGNTVQANSIVTLIQDTFNLNPVIHSMFSEIGMNDFAESLKDINLTPWISGIVLSTLTAFVIFGGIKSIASACERLVPFMAVFYILGSIVLLIIGYKTLLDSVVLIFNSAFTGHAAIGGFLGAGMKEAVRYGIARGLFSNESGLGSAPIVAASAQTRNPVRQALVSSSGTFWDTVVVCALTGLVLVNSGDWQHGVSGALLTKEAFSEFHIIGPILLSIALFTFVFSTILGWSFYGEKAVEYLFGEKSVKPYRMLWIIAIMIGSVASLPAVWHFADIANGLMAVPNIISLILLSGIIVKETKKYLWENKLDEK
ncbi:MAG: sodium:alanine symporter family protein [Ignavibacteria bacterium]|nr:sodium:alanine symporter family protein [Ignavibacteria bacterium]